MRQARPFQLAQFTSARDAFKRGLKHVIIEAPTGTGKAVSIAMMARMTKEKGGRVLILVNRDILVTQLIEELKTVEVFASREQGQERASLTCEVVVASIQSLGGKWLERWPRGHFRLVVLDEAHGSAASTFKRILDHFLSHPAGGHSCHFTATPERHDKRGLWKGVQDIVFSMTLKEAIDEGWLCGFEFYDLDCPVVLDEKLMNHATFSEGEEVFDSQKYLPRLAECAIAESAGRKGLFFLPNCRVSLGFAQMLKSLGLNAEHVDSSYMTATQTAERLAWFKDAKEGILCNADLLSVGFNLPSIDTIGLFRPIASTPMYKQRLGRGTRPLAPVDNFDTASSRKQAIADSIKPFCKVINVFFENGDHNLASPSCLITDDEDERKAIDKARKPGGNVDFASMEAQLKAKRMADQAEEERKFAEKVANSQAKKKRGAPFIGHILKMKHNGNPASSGQMIFLNRLGYKHDGPGLSKQQAYLITETYKRQKATAV